MASDMQRLIMQGASYFLLLKPENVCAPFIKEAPKKGIHRLLLIQVQQALAASLLPASSRGTNRLLTNTMLCTLPARTRGPKTCFVLRRLIISLQS
jgi:hypothetical protein